MKGFWGRVGALVIVGGAVSLAACAHDDSTLFVFDVLKGTVSGNMCTFTADTTSQFWSKGTLDVGLTHEYVAEFLVANQMVSQADPTIPKTETAFIMLNHVNVRVTKPDGTAVDSFSTPTAATIFPSTGTTPSFVAVGVPIVDDAAVTKLNVAVGGLARIEAFVTFFGKTTGGTSVESNEFQFPIDVCNGCLVAFPPAEDDLTKPGVNCDFATAASSTNSASTTSLPCTFGQDEQVDCSVCRNAFAVCKSQL